MIETDRLLLEPLDASRLEDFVLLTADPYTCDCWWADGPFTRDVAERSFAASLARVREHGFGKRWIVAKESGAGLGFTDTKYFGESCEDVSPDEVEIGWMLFPATWSRGYATEPDAPPGTRRSTGSRSKASSPPITLRTLRPDGSWRSSAWRSNATSLPGTVGRIAFTA